MAALLAVTGTYLALRAHVLGSLMEPGSIPAVDNPLAHVSAPVRIATALALTGRYFLLFLFPRHLSADYSFPQILPVSPLSLPAAAGAVLVLGLGWTTLKLRHRIPALSWGLGFAGCSFFLVSNLPFPIGTVFAERVPLPTTPPSSPSPTPGGASAFRASRTATTRAALALEITWPRP